MEAQTAQRLLEIVNGDLFADAFENLLNEINVQRMHLIIVLRLLGRENEIERDLIGLIHDGAMAANHFADVKLQHARNGLEILIGPGDQFFRRVGLRRIRPENDYVRKHARRLSAPEPGTQADSGRNNCMTPAKGPLEYLLTRQGALRI
jgi:hypothetical protein